MIQQGYNLNVAEQLYLEALLSEAYPGVKVNDINPFHFCGKPADLGNDNTMFFGSVICISFGLPIPYDGTQNAAVEIPTADFSETTLFYIQSQYQPMGNFHGLFWKLWATDPQQIFYFVGFKVQFDNIPHSISVPLPPVHAPEAPGDPGNGGGGGQPVQNLLVDLGYYSNEGTLDIRFVKTAGVQNVHILFPGVPDPVIVAGDNISVNHPSQAGAVTLIPYDASGNAGPQMQFFVNPYDYGYPRGSDISHVTWGDPVYFEANGQYKLDVNFSIDPDYDIIDVFGHRANGDPMILLFIALDREHGTLHVSAGDPLFSDISYLRYSMRKTMAAGGDYLSGNFYKNVEIG